MAEPAVPTEVPGGDQAPPNGLLPAELRTWMNLLAAAGAVEQHLRSVVKGKFGISHDEFLVLCMLAEQPGHALRMTQAADLLGRPKTRLTYQVVCLQRVGLVTRRTACGDKRGVEIALTDKARQLMGEAAPLLVDGVRQALLQVVSPCQRQALLGLLPNLADPGDPPGGGSAEASGGGRTDHRVHVDEI
jgi:DNA-binding MarR family transcriptional regulator